MNAFAASGDTRGSLKIAAILQFVGGLVSLPIPLSFIYNELNDWKVYGHGSGDLHRALFWAAAPIAAVLAPFLWARLRWAWWGSVLVAPMYALGPWLDVATLRGSLHGGEILLMMAGLVGAGAALVIGLLLRRGRTALRA